jgi:PAS domain S-box-containing protein
MIDVLRAIADTVGVALDNARLYQNSRENQSRLSAILQSSADGIIATDHAGRMELMNQAAERLLGVSAGSLVGLPVREAPMNDKVRSALMFAMSSRSEGIDRVFQVTPGHGRTLSILVSPVYVTNPMEQQGNTDGWVIVLQDVTNLHEAEAARTQFIQAAAHDMRNPLGVAMHALEILGDMVRNRAGAREVIGLATTSISRVQGLINDLLNLERIESGHGFVLTEVHIGDLVDEVVAEVRPALTERRQRFSADVSRGLPRLRLDRRWVVRAMLNYLENACKYTEPGGRINLRIFTQAPMLHVEVSDSGPGITLEAQSHLFERFYRVDGHSNVPGSGLGLAIVKSVAEAHGGSVYVHSRPGQGSTFGMTLLIQ